MIKSLTQLSLVAGSLTLAISATAPAQALTIYTDANGGRAAWEAAITNLGFNFTTDTFSTNRAEAATITFDSGVVSTGVGGTGSNFISGGRYTGFVETASTAFPTAYDQITWTFPTAVVGFAADWFNTASAARLTVRGNFDGTGNQTVNFFTQLGSPGDGFLGIVGNAPFSTVVFDTAGGGSESYQADNLSFSTTPIPTPALLPGLVGMGLAAWRKRKAEA
jgi:hypothetical protein